MYRLPTGPTKRFPETWHSGDNSEKQECESPVRNNLINPVRALLSGLVQGVCRFPCWAERHIYFASICSHTVVKDSLNKRHQWPNIRRESDKRTATVKIDLTGGSTPSKYFQHSVSLICSSHRLNKVMLKIARSYIVQVRSIKAEFSPSFGIYITADCLIAKINLGKKAELRD